MKVKILLKNIKKGDTITGTHYCIKSLFVSFDEADVYEKIVKHLQAMGCSIEQIEKFCKPKEYKEVVSYAFGLNCSNFTFDRVDRFGILDAKIIFSQNDKGYVYAKIQVVDKKEQIDGYEPPTSLQDEEVEGWSTPAPAARTTETPTFQNAAETLPIPTPNFNSLNPKDVEDLPF